MEKQVLITGASGGIGLALVKAIAKEGYSVVAHYHRNVTLLKEASEEILSAGGKIRLLQFDIGNREECREVLERDIRENGVYYGVVNNAGICRDGAFPALTDENWDQVIDTNLNGFFNCLHPVVMPMCRAKQPARIITMASVAGIIGNRGQVNYSASKAGIIGATKALAIELASRKITVNCVAPGLIETEMSKDAPLDKILPSIPLGRAGKPEEVAAVVIFLLSESASYITRQVISVNGGLI
ncbi:MAG: 3-oxoacyl-ACP reductase FabG [Fibrobacter sp.]|jgi:3-oxoacyl-[acyl-carrier protein] reductase|nr:3-oxoacyl-ACP reductase FabG [Fibrobacter sp.]